jgi:integrase
MSEIESQVPRSGNDSRPRWPPHLRRVLTVAYDVGPRKGELLALDWSDVDMRRKEFTLRHTKNGETRVVPMTPTVHAVFQECWQDGG